MGPHQPVYKEALDGSDEAWKEFKKQLRTSKMAGTDASARIAAHKLMQDAKNKLMVQDANIKKMEAASRPARSSWTGLSAGVICKLSKRLQRHQSPSPPATTRKELLPPLTEASKSAPLAVTDSKRLSGRKSRLTRLSISRPSDQPDSQNHASAIDYSIHSTSVLSAAAAEDAEKLGSMPSDDVKTFSENDSELLEDFGSAPAAAEHATRLRSMSYDEVKTFSGSNSGELLEGFVPRRSARSRSPAPRSSSVKSPVGTRRRTSRIAKRLSLGEPDALAIARLDLLGESDNEESRLQEDSPISVQQLFPKQKVKNQDVDDEFLKGLLFMAPNKEKMIKKSLDLESERTASTAK